MKTELQGYWLPVLHAHLPFVKHPEFDYFLEENWLFEAITESYIPLMMIIEKLRKERCAFRLTLSLSPPLMEMLDDELLAEKYDNYLKRLIQLSEKEKKRLRSDRDLLKVAKFYHKRHNAIRKYFHEKLNHNLLNGVIDIFKAGYVEIITSAATHGMLPLLNANPSAVDVQVSVSVESFERRFGCRPEGMWLPECAYFDGLDTVLNRHGIKFFFLDAHGIMNGNPAPRYGVYAPVFSAQGVAAFGRDPLSSKQVWSAEEGYPGDFHYRDFYRDAGYDLDLDYIKPFISPDGSRVFTGIKYHRITGKTDEKDIYDPDIAVEKAREHAGHFHFERIRQAQSLNNVMDRPPVIVSPYDAELFGHWWYEGPEFLYFVLSDMSRHGLIKSITASEYLGLHTLNQIVSPAPTSWGNKGYYDAWLNSGNDWIYRHLHHMANRMVDLANNYYDEKNKKKVRLLNQLLRELLLAQSSDWAFLITTNTAREYSEKRIKEHISNFNYLYEAVVSDKIDMKRLRKLESKNSVFRDIDFRVFASRKH